ncbi:MAG: HAD family hydrolase [Spirochaetes bacterium RBG_13_68_11]|nr:MAG: HAD family hydrolase [Spirochaetes bacterium RBG_13_68_11]
MPAELSRQLAFLFTDIDDTLTSEGMLPAGSYSALWDLHDAGIRVVPVTGRPAGWCDHIARMWPVDGVVGENGAFYYRYDRIRRAMTRNYTLPPAELAAGRQRLAALAERVLREVPGTAIAADQPFRISDFAIDFREDVPPLPPASVDAISRILADGGVTHKVSSIHVNFWIGGFDKLSCARRFLEQQSGSSFDAAAERAVFVGDSPNDEPLFAGFPHTIAVANIRAWLDRLVHLPEFVTTADAAEGFQEAVNTILARRGG